MIYANKTVVGIFKSPSELSERIDELIYGQEVQVISHIENEGHQFSRIKTKYDYEGYVRSSDLLCHETQYDPTYRIVQPSTDVLSEAKYASSILITLTKGAIILYTGIYVDKWEKVQLLDGRYGFIRTGFAKKIEKDNHIVETAFDYLGVQYRWGGRTSLGIDCSGLVSISYEMNGYTIPRDADLQQSYFKTIPFEEAKSGDLYFFPGHVAIALGNLEYIHATGRDGKVVVNSFDPQNENYRQDLAESLLETGTLF